MELAAWQIMYEPVFRSVSLSVSAATSEWLLSLPEPLLYMVYMSVSLLVPVSGYDPESVPVFWLALLF